MLNKINNIFIQNKLLQFNTTDIYNFTKSWIIDLTNNEFGFIKRDIDFNFITYSLNKENFICLSNISFIRRNINNEFILNSFRLKPEFQNNFEISNFIPVYNTDDYLITIFNEKEEVYKHFLWKDKKVYEIETERRVYMFNFRCFNI